MRTIESLMRPDRIKADVLRIPLEAIADRSGRARGEGVKEGWIRGLSMARIPLPELTSYPALSDEIHWLLARVDASPDQLVQVIINRLDPGSALARHRDGPPDHERWHLPVFTSRGVVWWDEINGTVHMFDGRWWGPVPYCGVLHSMTNGGEQARYHVIVDIDREGTT